MICKLVSSLFASNEPELTDESDNESDLPLRPFSDYPKAKIEKVFRNKKLNFFLLLIKFSFLKYAMSHRP